MTLDRRTFNKGLASSAASLLLAGSHTPALGATYKGSNVIIVRFGGGVRRAETIDSKGSYAPFLVNTLAKHGVLIPDVQIANLNDMDTSHAEGTINILTGRYAAWRDAGSKFLLQRIEPTSPTLFEYLRKTYKLAPHQALLINGEDRPQEEFFSFARHRNFGGDFRAEVLSLYRFKHWLYHKLQRQNSPNQSQLETLREQLQKFDDHALPGRTPRPNSRLDRFWANWRKDYRENGLINPRGDRLLTSLALRAMRDLRPRLMMINYQDPDYVHWGNASHYTRAIAIIDEGLRQLVEKADQLDHYANNTVFIIVPDCGRDANPLTPIPFQHHFNSKSAHEIWALVVGPGITKGRVLDKLVDQSQIAATVGAIMAFKTPYAKAPAIAEIFS